MHKNRVEQANNHNSDVAVEQHCSGIGQKGEPIIVCNVLKITWVELGTHGYGEIDFNSENRLQKIQFKKLNFRKLISEKFNNISKKKN